MLQENTPLGQGVHAAQDIEQGGLPRAAGAHDHAQLPLAHREGGVPQGLDLDLPHLVDFFYMLEADKYAHMFSPRRIGYPAGPTGAQILSADDKQYYYIRSNGKMVKFS